VKLIKELKKKKKYGEPIYMVVDRLLNIQTKDFKKHLLNIQTKRRS